MRIAQPSLGIKPLINTHLPLAPAQRLRTASPPPPVTRRRPSVHGDALPRNSQPPPPPPAHLCATQTVTVVVAATEATLGPDVLNIMRDLATDFSLQQLQTAPLHFQQTANTWQPTHHFITAETEKGASFSGACLLTAPKTKGAIPD